MFFVFFFLGFFTPNLQYSNTLNIVATNNSFSYEKDLVDTVTDEFLKGLDVDKQDDGSSSTNKEKNHQSLINNTKDSSYINIITSRGNGIAVCFIKFPN